MNRWLMCVAAVAMTSGSLAAQETLRASGGPLAPPGLQPGVGYPAYRIPPADARSPLAACLNKHGVACAAHHSWFGTGSFHSEAAFLYCSSRTFFNEPCFPKAPRTPHSWFSIFGRRSCGE